MRLQFISVNCQMLCECFITYRNGMRMLVQAVRHHRYTEASERYPWTLGAAALESSDALPTAVFLTCPSNALSKPEALVAGQHLCEQDDPRRRNILCRDKQNFFLFED